ncbi:MAG TPA: hypothetical protein VGU23_10525 [Acidobacteriaceae bacterium]|nr:hypothetical protein [Acidobacteriaceae bacterium]
MILPRLILIATGIIVALLGAFGRDTYFHVPTSSDIPFYRRICVVIGFIIILAALCFAPHHHH